MITRQHAKADEPTNSVNHDEEVAALVEKLSDPEFAARESASKRLLEIGPPALEILRKAKKHPAIEVRERADRICEEIDKVLFENVTKKFILAADGTQSFGLPAWEVFRSISGDSRTSKLMFVTMLRSQSEVASYVESANLVRGTADYTAAQEQLALKAKTVAERLRLRTFRGELPSVGDTVGLLLACSILPDGSSTASVSNEVNEVIVASLYRPKQTEFFRKPGYDRCMRALTGQWISKTQAALAGDVLSIAHLQKIPEGAIVARRHLDALNDRETRVSALQCLLDFGNEGDIPAVSKLLDEEIVVYEYTDQRQTAFPSDDIREEDMPPPGMQPVVPPRDDRRMIVRLSDFALAVCMSLGSEDLTEAFPRFDRNESSEIIMQKCAFPSDGQDAHKLAIARWKQQHPEYFGKAN